MYSGILIEILSSTLSKVVIDILTFLNFCFICIHCLNNNATYEQTTFIKVVI